MGVMKNTSRTQSAKAGKRKPWFRGKYSAAAPREIVKAEATKAPRFYPTEDKKIKLTNNKANNKADTTAVTDCQFKKPKSAKKKSEDGPFAAAEEKKPLDDAAKALQEKVDGPVVKAIEAESMLKDYMRARFSLKNGQYPHEMSF